MGNVSSKTLKHQFLIWSVSLLAPLAHAHYLKKPLLPYFIFWALGVRFAIAGCV